MGEAALLAPQAIRLAESAVDRAEAIRRCGSILVDIGAVTADYIEAMLHRERSVSTFVGEGVAIPHGTPASKKSIRNDALAVVRFPRGVDWGGFEVKVCVAIAARGNSHVSLLASLAGILLDPRSARALREATEPDEVIRLLAPVRKDSTA